MNPQIGMSVLYYPHPSDSIETNCGQPLAATVVAVMTTSWVHLSVLDAKGQPRSRLNVSFVQSPDDKPMHGCGHCVANVPTPATPANRQLMPATPAMPDAPVEKKQKPVRSAAE